MPGALNYRVHLYGVFTQLSPQGKQLLISILPTSLGHIILPLIYRYRALAIHLS